MKVTKLAAVLLALTACSLPGQLSRREDPTRYEPLEYPTFEFAVSSRMFPLIGAELQWTSVDYRSGRRGRADCADVVSVPVPVHVRLPRHPGCGLSLSERIKRWLD